MDEVGKKCPQCGSIDVLPHARGTFRADGWICLTCGYVFPGEWPSNPRVIVKGWRTREGKPVGG